MIVRLIGKLFKAILSVLFTLVLIAIGLYIYARYIEPELLIVKEEKINTSHLQWGKEGIRIVQFSDLHLGENYTISHLQRVVQQINELEPDLVIFSGDLVDNNKQFNEVKETIKALGRIEASLGKYAVYGNHDHGANGTKQYQKIMKEAGFRLLKNESHKLKLSSGEYINIIGCDDILLGKMDISAAMQDIHEEDFNLFISHAPDIADQILKYPIDLQMSGHSHGGQVSIPFIGAPFTPPYGSKYVSGKYSFNENKRMLLYVNTGIGTSQLHFRFCNVPQITLFVLSSE